MRTTRHFETRCIQRRIADHEVKLALRFGIAVRDKRTLGEKSCLALIQAIDVMTRVIEEAEEKGALAFDDKAM